MACLGFWFPLYCPVRSFANSRNFFSRADGYVLKRFFVARQHFPLSRWRGPKGCHTAVNGADIDLIRYGNTFFFIISFRFFVFV